MKQHITNEQWDELTIPQKAVLTENHKFAIVLVSIGEMIEFLGEEFMEIENGTLGWKIKRNFHMAYRMKFIEDELVDALWEAVKAELKSNV